VVWDDEPPVAKERSEDPTAIAGSLDGIPRWPATGGAWWPFAPLITSAAWARWPWPACRRSCATERDPAPASFERPSSPADAAAGSALTLTPEQDAPAGCGLQPRSLPAVRRHPQRQDRGVPAGRAAAAGARPVAQALVMVPESTDAAIAGAFRSSASAPASGRDEQRHDPSAAPEELAGGPHRRARIVLGTRMAVFAPCRGSG